ncbi:MAG TPA: ATP-grasp fold amidoligase family protein [Methylomirabilota bacterium]|jgi:teichuronopeptide biosynthesis TupA-like protein|nr:ATP-grasp fold amidoligase family protein [Methylomirabilota bacterium]
MIALISRILDVSNTLRALKQRRAIWARRSHGEKILLQRYARLHGTPLNVTNPRTFTEKLFCRMIAWNRGHDPIFTQLTDKYAARDYVRSRVGEQPLVELLWHGTDPRAIPFDALPASYVVKTNHACGQVILVEGKADDTEIVDKVSAWLKSNFYWVHRERQYYDIEPRVIVEEYLRNQDGSRPLNYKFWCFGGTPEVIHVSNYAHNLNSFFDPHWNLLDLHYREGVARPAIPRPIDFERMIQIASQLSAGFDFVRVDLYNLDGRICFGELTFTPMAGDLTLRPESWDLALGEKWKMASTAHTRKRTSEPYVGYA